MYIITVVISPTTSIMGNVVFTRDWAVKYDDLKQKLMMASTKEYTID